MDMTSAVLFSVHGGRAMARKAAARGRGSVAYGGRVRRGKYRFSQGHWRGLMRNIPGRSAADAMGWVQQPGGFPRRGRPSLRRPLLRNGRTAFWRVEVDPASARWHRWRGPSARGLARGQRHGHGKKRGPPRMPSDLMARRGPRGSGDRPGHRPGHGISPAGRCCCRPSGSGPSSRILPPRSPRGGRP